jgi:hypothetical protein
VRLVTHGTGASGRAPISVAHGIKLIGRAARPVTRDRTRPVVEGAYWTPTGRWHCRVWSLSGARPVDASQARCYALGASGRLGSASGRSFDRWNAVSTVEIGRARLNLEGHVDGAGRSDAIERVQSGSTGASGRPKKHPVKGYNGSIRLGCL